MITQFGDWFKLCEATKTSIDISLYDSEFPTFELSKANFKRMTMDEIYDYYMSVLNGRFDFIIQNEDTLSCDYCEVIADLYWIRRCTACNKNMCNLCWNERTEEIATTLGSTNWAERKEALETCFRHEKEGKMKIRETKLLQVTCNLCKRSSAYVIGNWFSNRSVDQDLCEACAKSADGIYFMAYISGKWKMEKYESFQLLLYDWLPLYKDENENLLVYNIRKDSPYYHRLIESERNVDNRQPPKYIYNLNSEIRLTENEE